MSEEIRSLDVGALTGVTPNTGLLVRAFTPPVSGTLSITAKVSSGAAAASLEVSRNAGGLWGTVASLTAGAEVRARVDVMRGQSIQVGVDAATSLDVLMVLYVPGRLLAS